MNYRKLYFIIVLFLLCTGCDASLVTPTVSLPEFVTATLPPTAVSAPTQTSLPPTVAPTITPIAGRTTTEVNVRKDTSTVSESLGTLPAFSMIQIIGKDASGYWLQVLFNNNTGWVRADFVQVENAAAEIPVVGAEAGIGTGMRGVVLRGVNVRSGAGKDFTSLGLLNQNDVVSILGKDSSGEWIKIEYPIAPDGMGWVAAEFLQIENVNIIPVLGEEMQPTETEAANALTTPLATLPARAAIMDGDTADAPLALFDLSAVSARSVQFQGEVSAPEGDTEDWLGFSSQHANVVIQVLCNSDGIQVELLQAGAAPSLFELGCGDTQQIQVNPGDVYWLRIHSTVTGEPTLTKYQVRIRLGN